MYDETLVSNCSNKSIAGINFLRVCPIPRKVHDKDGTGGVYLLLSFVMDEWLAKYKRLSPKCPVISTTTSLGS